VRATAACIVVNQGLTAGKSIFDHNRTDDRGKKREPRRPNVGAGPGGFMAQQQWLAHNQFGCLAAGPRRLPP